MRTFNEFMADKFTPDFSGKASYYKPDTMDQMAMMPPQQLAQFAWQRFEKQGGPDHDVLPENWWEQVFGSNVFKLLQRNKIVIWNKGRWVWNPQYANQ